MYIFGLESETVESHAHSAPSFGADTSREIPESVRLLGTTDMRGSFRTGLVVGWHAQI